ncbi:MAG: sigma-70 family RNA polymerase sigma factor [Planctomycetota bacterium]|jgi:RNA polymerase sigma factor (TIGR02999 family)
MIDEEKDITLLLKAVSDGDPHGWKRLIARVYQELHTLAHSAMRKEPPNHTLQTTALVHEAYLRLIKDKDEQWKNRTHFFSAAASAMRRILVDKARYRKAEKRGGGHERVPLHKVDGLDQRITSLEKRFEDLEALNQALDKLGSQDEYKRMCTMVELRYFVGFTLQQTAEVLGVSLATIKRDWEFAKAWLLKEMRGRQDHA